MFRQVSGIALVVALCACTFDDSASLPVAGNSPGPAADAGAQDALGQGALWAWFPVPTAPTRVDDIAGDYYRAFPLYGDIAYLSLGELALGSGTYLANRSCGLVICPPESGDYYAVPENPAVGFAFLSLHGADGSEESYIIDSIWRADDGAVVALQVRSLSPGGAIGLPFTFNRVIDGADPDDDVAALVTANSLSVQEMMTAGELSGPMAAAVVERRELLRGFTGLDQLRDIVPTTRSVATCDYYQGLSEYYTIRALQCAYSICYPMSPWYGFWASYYHDRAVACWQDEGIEP